MARTTDTESAASRMEKGLNKLLTGVAAAQIQETVQRELASAVQKAVRFTPAQQQQVEAPYQPTPMPWRTQGPAAQTPQAEGDLSQMTLLIKHLGSHVCSDLCRHHLYTCHLQPYSRPKLSQVSNQLLARRCRRADNRRPVRLSCR